MAPLNRALVLSALALCACRFEAGVPPPGRIACAADSDCPSPLRCQPGLSRCVTEVDDLPPFIVPGSVKLSLRLNALAPTPVALASDGNARIAFIASEPLARPPALETSPALDCLVAPSSQPEYVFECRALAGGADGPVSITARLVDFLENAANVPVEAGLVLDTTPPPPPLASTPNLVVHFRAPTGAEETAGVPAFRVNGAPGSAPGALRVDARMLGLEAGTAPVSADGSFGAIELPPIDTTDVEVRAVDDSGNASGWVRVRDGRWVATPGSDTAAHRLTLVGAQGPGWLRGDGRVAPLAQVQRVDGVTARVSGAASWRRGASGNCAASALVSARNPVARDSARGTVVGFGRFTRALIPSIPPISCIGTSEETWQWSPLGARWRLTVPSDLESDGNPPGRTGHVLAWDPVGRRTLLYGGINYSCAGFISAGYTGTPLHDLWSWDGTSWKRLSDGPLLGKPAGFFDERAGKLVVTGEGATWTFGNDDTWTLVDAGVLPVLAEATAAYDPRRGEAWLLGRTAAGAAGSAWKWQGSSWLAADAGPVPAASEATLIWVTEEDRGYLLGSGPDAGFWRFDGASFAALAAPPNEVTGGWFEPSRGQVLVTVNEREATLDRCLTTLDLNDAGWRLVTRLRAPSLVQGGITCAGPLGGCAVVASGNVHVLAADGYNPRMTVGPLAKGLGFDVVDQHLLALTPTQTLVFSVDGGAEPSLPAAGVSPTAAYVTVSAGAAGVFVLPSGAPAVSRLDGGAWQTLAPLPSPTGATSGRLLADQAQGLIVQSQGRLLLLDAGGWWPLTTGPVSEVQPVFDADRGRVVVAGGIDNLGIAIGAVHEQVRDGGWEFLPMPTSDPEGDGSLSARYGAHFGYDGLRHTYLLHGGTVGSPGVALSDTWELGVYEHRPAALFTVATRLAGLDPSTVTRITVRANAGGCGQGTGGPARGARLSVLLDDWWHPLGTASTADCTAPTPLEADITDPSELARLTRNRPELNVSIEPVGFNGPDYAALSIDYVELGFEYRLP